jgi:hypothetical protein
MVTPAPPRRLFPPQEGVTLRNKGERSIHVLTANGDIELCRRYFAATGVGSAAPVDAVAGVDGQRGGVAGTVSPGAREILCVFGQTQSFRCAARHTGRIGHVPVSAEKLRQVVEATAHAVRQERESGRLPAAWRAEQAKTDQGQPRVYQGADGVLVPTVTQAEKDRRRQRQQGRRRQRQQAGIGNAKPLPTPRRGSDQRYKEMKIGVFYDQDKTRCHAFATENPSECFGSLLKTYGDQIAVCLAVVQLIALVDGAKWIAAQVTLAFRSLRMLLLDFYHMAQHVHATAVCCLGDTQAAKTWARQRLEEVKTVGVAPVLAAIDALHKQVRSKARRESLESLRHYLTDRLAMLHYPQAIAAGWDIGSGPTEALCKTFTLRLKRPGMKWDRDHAADLMNLQALDQSDQAERYWASLRAA